MAKLRKMSLERFQENSSKVIQLVNNVKMHIIVYNENGPVAQITPSGTIARKQKAREAPAVPDTKPMDQGGVWTIDSEARKKIIERQQRWKYKLASNNSFKSLARFAALLPFSGKFS